LHIDGVEGIVHPNSRGRLKTVQIKQVTHGVCSIPEPPHPSPAVGGAPSGVALVSNITILFAMPQVALGTCCRRSPPSQSWQAAHRVRLQQRPHSEAVQAAALCVRQLLCQTAIGLRAPRQLCCASTQLTHLHLTLGTPHMVVSPTTTYNRHGVLRQTRGQILPAPSACEARCQTWRHDTLF
jgi:hypothetical protein